MTIPAEEAIRARAQQLWEQAGRPQGRDQEFWLQAELDLKNDGATNAEEKERRLAEERRALKLQRRQRLEALVRKRKANLQFLKVRCNILQCDDLLFSM